LFGIFAGQISDKKEFLMSRLGLFSIEKDYCKRCKKELPEDFARIGASYRTLCKECDHETSVSKKSKDTLYNFVKI